MFNHLSSAGDGPMQTMLRMAARYALVLWLIFLAYTVPINQAHANIYNCLAASTTFSPALTTPMYYPKSYSSTTPVVVYSGTLYWKLTNCTNSYSNPGTNANNSLGVGPVIAAPGLTVAGTGVIGVTKSTCTGSTKSATMVSTNAYSSWTFIYPGNSESCTYPFPFTISTNSAVTTSSGGTSSITQLTASTSFGWVQGVGVWPGADGTNRVAATGIAIEFIPRSCTITNSSLTITLPTVSLSEINKNGNSSWTTWPIELTSCANISASGNTAAVTFDYTELGSTGSKIIAPDATSTSTNVGVQIGFNGTALASGTAQALGTVTSAGTTFTMQARFAKPTGTTAKAGTVKNATATYIMTYN